MGTTYQEILDNLAYEKRKTIYLIESVNVAVLAVMYYMLSKLPLTGLENIVYLLAVALLIITVRALFKASEPTNLERLNAEFISNVHEFARLKEIKEQENL